MNTIVKIVKIGNSQGVRLSKKALEETGLSGNVELVIGYNELIIRPLLKTREGWEQSYIQMSKSGDDKLLIGEQPPTEWDKSDWQW